jgi:hypothetical protein
MVRCELKILGTVRGWEPDRFMYRVGPLPPGTGRTGPGSHRFCEPCSRSAEAKAGRTCGEQSADRVTRAVADLLLSAPSGCRLDCKEHAQGGGGAAGDRHHLTRMRRGQVVPASTRLRPPSVQTDDARRRRG